MTTTTTITIRYGRSTLGPDTTDEQARDYERTLAAAVNAAYPGASVNVIGERSDLSTTVRGVDEDEQEAIRDLANRTWETWCRSPDTIATICQSHGVSIEMSPEDASWATSSAMPLADARALVAALRSAGHEASEATDSDDASLAWVHVTREE